MSYVLTTAPLLGWLIGDRHLRGPISAALPEAAIPTTVLAEALAVAGRAGLVPVQESGRLAGLLESTMGARLEPVHVHDALHSARLAVEHPHLPPDVRAALALADRLGPTATVVYDVADLAPTGPARPTALERALELYRPTRIPTGGHP